MKEIHLWGVKQNNLKNVEVKIPLGSFTVVCGPSGSGKSSLAFETLFAEGQRRFIESMSSYARQFLNKAPKPDIEGINNIPPAIAIEQKNSVKSSRSTVGTATEIVDYLRLFFEKLGVAYCPTHNCPTEKESVTEASDKVLKNFSGKRGYILCEIKADGRIAEGKKLHSLLLQDGYLRIYLPKTTQEPPAKKNKATKKSKKTEPAQTSLTQELLGEVIEIGDPKTLKKGLPKESFFLVIDRLSFNEEDRGRVVDSIAQAYSASVKYNQNISTRHARIITTEGQQLKVSEESCCPVCGYIPPPVTSSLFSFNSPIGACPTCKGFGNILDIDEAKVIPNTQLSLAQGALSPFTMPSATQDRKALMSYCKKAKIDTHTPWADLPPAQRKALWDGNKDFFGVRGLFAYLEQLKYKMHVRVFISRYRSPFLCPNCRGSRLRSEAHHVYAKGHRLQDLTCLTIEELSKVFNEMSLTENEQSICNEIFKQIRSRLDFLLRVGVHYLTMDRETRTLSGGEFQRLNLANQLGMGLSQALYVLDEPTVGLHPRDNDRLISILKDLKNLGNTLVIVEHDQDVIRSSDHVIEIGPGSGYLGGEIIYSGLTSEFYEAPQSITAPFLKSQKTLTSPNKLRPIDKDSLKYKIELSGAHGNNLKNINVTFPLNRLVVVTGVSGSGKSTLITHTLYPLLARKLEVDFIPAQPADSVSGFEHIKDIVMIDQSPIGKSARSSPITFLKAFDSIRNLMAATPDAKARGYTPGTFSLNVDGGRCPACKGTGFEEIDMMFMDNVIIPCDVCDGKKYRDEILEITYRHKNISQILAMTVQEAMDFFVAHPNVRKPLSVLKDVGLDYLQLGQPASSLSGGESQRLKIARELSQVQQKSTLYILDEPTTGLHFREIGLLMRVLNKLIETGGSVIVVEHNLDVIVGADYLVDLGPEAGKHGGKVVFQGTPQEIIKCKASLTGQYLKKYLTKNL